MKLLYSIKLNTLLVFCSIIIIKTDYLNCQTDTLILNYNNDGEYIKVLYDECPNADILEAGHTDDYIEIEYSCEGKLYKMGISDNKIIFKETKAEKSIIPFDKILKKLDKKYQGWFLDEISLITTENNSFLKAEIIKEGIEQNLFFTLEGKWYKSKSLSQSGKWNSDKLKETKLFKEARYSLLEPDETYYLPEILKEISGIALNDNKLYCVQDELGVVFDYDLSEEKINHLHRFTDIGDFEDITIKDEMMYVIRSDGNIFYFNYKNKTDIKQKFVSLNALDIESLTYNQKDNYFYSISKDAMANSNESKRIIHRFIFENAHKPEQYFEIDIDELNNNLEKNFGKLKKGKEQFNPSALTFHPITNDIYVLSATDRLLVVVSNKKLKAVYPLPTHLYYKPEGLAFYGNGDLLISSEGDKKGLISGSIMLFKYK